MKKLIVILILFLSAVTVQAVETERLTEERQVISPETMIEDQLQQLDLKQLKQAVERLNKETSEYLPELTIRDMVRLFTQQEIKGKFKQILKGLGYYLFQEVMVNTRLLGQLILLAIIAALLKNLQANFASKEVSRLANTLVFLVLLIMALNSFRTAVNIGREAVVNMVGVMQAILPVLLSLLVSMGNLTSASLFHPLTFLIVNALSTVVKNLVFPLIFLTTILDITNQITDRFQVTGLAGLIKQLTLGGLGVITTIFGAAILTQGLVASVSDGVVIRTTKYLTGSFVPIVGSFLANTLDLVIGGTLLLKNALGIFGVGVVLLFCSYSIIKIIILVFIYRLAGAIIQPVGNNRLVSCFNKLANNLLLVFGAVTVVGVMFFVVILIVVATANFTVMLR